MIDSWFKFRLGAQTKRDIELKLNIRTTHQVIGHSNPNVRLQAEVGDGPLEEADNLLGADRHVSALLLRRRLFCNVCPIALSGGNLDGPVQVGVPGCEKSSIVSGGVLDTWKKTLTGVLRNPTRS